MQHLLDAAGPAESAAEVQTEPQSGGPRGFGSGNPEDVYSCVFVESGFEQLVVHTVEYCGYGEALALRKIMPHYQKDKTWRDVNRALLPGYIFIRGEAVNYRLRRINHVIRLLRYADGKSALRGADRAFAERAFQTGGTIPKLQAHWEGSFVRVTDDLLRTMNGRVIRVDKRDHCAEIEIDLVGTANRIWLGLDLPARKAADPLKNEMNPDDEPPQGVPGSETEYEARLSADNGTRLLG